MKKSFFWLIVCVMLSTISYSQCGPYTATYEIDDAALISASYNIGCNPTHRAYAQGLTGPYWGFRWTDALPIDATVSSINVEISMALNCNTPSSTAVFAAEGATSPKISSR